MGIKKTIIERGLWKEKRKYWWKWSAIKIIAILSKDSNRNSNNNGCVN